jgi:aspartate/methionine/tyrosine aminotransferase
MKKYPFEKLNELLRDIKVKEVINLTIGEPQFQTPHFIQKVVCENISFLNKYPKTAGEEFLKKAQRDFVKRRFEVELLEDELLPTFGTREVLFNFPIFLKPKKVAFPTPFYQVYEGAALVAGSKINYLPLKKENDFKPSLKDVDKDVDFIILNSPNNPTSSVMDFEELCEWIKWADKIGAVILNDECYSEIYTSSPPASILQASLKVKGNLKGVLSINSISKRSSAPGLRSGFIAGDRDILRKYLTFRTYTGCAIPLPLQYGAKEAWEDEEYPSIFRKKYKRNFEIAKEILGIDIPKATFYLWLEVGDDIEFTKRVYKKGVKVMPGRFMGEGGEGFVRIALVYEEEIIKKALKIIKEELC